MRGRVKDVLEYTPRQHRRYIARISRAEAKKRPVLSRSMRTLFAWAAIYTLEQTLRNTMLGKLKRKVKPWLIGLFWRLTLTKSVKENLKQYTGRVD